jgi:hypothetical protein
VSDYSSITDEQLMDTLRAVVAESPDKIYARPEHMPALASTTCFYVHTDTDGAPEAPGCIVGTVLNRLGVPLEVLAEHEGDAAHKVLTELGIGSWRTQTALRYAQSRQDAEGTWTSALAEAERAYAA